MFSVIFACVHNAGRSQMASAYFNQMADPGKARAISAGTEPGERVHPEVMAVMREVGIDLSGAKPQKLTEGLAREAQLLITMGCGDQCPYVPGLRRADWPLRDPKGLLMQEVRLIRDEIRSRVQELLTAESLMKFEDVGRVCEGDAVLVKLPDFEISGTASAHQREADVRVGGNVFMRDGPWN